MYMQSHIKKLLALLFLVPALALAGEQSGDDKSDRDSMGHMKHMAEKLELTDSQKEQWKDLHEGYHPRMKEIHKEMKEQREALHKASKNGFDEAQAESAADRLGELTSEASLMRARMHAEVREILTEEQLEKFDKYYDEAKKHKQHDKHHKKDHGMKEHDNHREHNRKRDDKQEP